MIRSLYTTVSGMITQEAKQDVITNNLSNVNTVGFKCDDLSVKGFDEVLAYNYDKVVNGKNVRQDLGNLSLGSRIDQVTTSFTQGTLEKTDKKTDFAVVGRGFFTVQRNDGVSTRNFYTRDGHFHVNNQGFLVNDSGDNVMGRNIRTGRTEAIRVNGDEMILNGDGDLLLNGTPTYKFNISDFNNYKLLKKVGDNLYSGENPTNMNNSTVKQNFLERSNVNSIKNMIDMMQVMRTFETNQKVMQSIDETLGKAVNEVGSVR